MAYPEERVRRVAVGVFGLGEGRSAWEDARDYLVKNDWLRLGATDASGQSALRLPTDAYLDTCVAAIYPVAGRRIEDDFEALRVTLSAPPVDSGALFSLAEALNEDPLGDKAAQGEMALACVQTGLSALDPQRQAQDWAGGQLTLGTMYGTRIRGEQAENLEASITAYEQALTVRTRATFPTDWAATTYNVGLLRETLAEEAQARGDLAARRAHLVAALEAMSSTLSVWTADGFPDYHARATAAIERIEAILREAEA